MRSHVTGWLWTCLLAVLVISTASSDDCNTSDLQPKCLNGGTCVDGMPGRHSCICPPGITGDRCEDQINDCASNPCKNKAACLNDLNRYRCLCLPGWTGTICDLDINECDSNPCQNQGQCYNGRNFYNCTCWDGFTGVNCENNANDCDQNPCQNGGTCTDLVDRFSCTCRTGFIGSRCERKLGECPDIEGFPDGHVTIHRKKFAFYKCNAGYKMSGIRFRQCKNGQWTGKAPVCIQFKRSCEEPDDILHGGYNGDSFIVGSKVKYFCGEKYVLRGNAEVTCGPNLKWYAKETPYCIRRKKCQDPGTPKHGSRDGTLFLEGTQVRFSCNKGYELVGSSTLSCARVCRKCTSVGWKGIRPKCEKNDPLRALKKVALTLRKNFIDKLGWLTSDGLARSGLSTGAEGLDLVFVVDSSASVGKENFKKGINFTKTIIEEFGISTSPTGTRVAVVTFSSQAQLVFNLKSKEITTKKKANAVLDNLDYIAGGTATSLALNMTIEKVVPQTRNNSKKALFLITDGQSNDGGDPRAEARILRHFLDFEIYAIGVTNMVDEDELQGIASDPFKTHVFLLKDFADLSKLKEIITAKETDYSECGIAGDTQLTEGADGKKIENAGGREAKRGAWPWQVAVYVKGNFRCAGALIKEDWVLTIAHCFYFHGKISAANVVVRLGDHDRFKEEGSEQNVGAEKLFLHPQANPHRIGDDVALVKLRSGVKLSPFVRPVCLPEPNDVFYVRPGKSCVIAGWGSTQMVSRVNLAGPPHPVLQQIQIKFVSNQRCQVNATNATDITDKVICAGDSEGERNACKGDNGSPLVIRRSDDSWVVIGLSSWGEGCATRGKYGVYTLVRSYTRWINRRINKFKKNVPK